MNLLSPPIQVNASSYSWNFPVLTSLNNLLLNTFTQNNQTEEIVHSIKDRRVVRLQKVLGKDWKEENGVIYSEKPFSTDINKIIRTHASVFKEVTFHFSPEKGGIFRFDEQGKSVEAPHSKSFMQWPTDSSWNKSVKRCSLFLEKGQEKIGAFSRDTFVKHSLFKDTLEKDFVFDRLLEFSKDLSFKSKYMAFCKSIQRGDPKWLESYKNQPFLLAYLSLYAFLEGKIEAEDLFTLHMFASAFSENPKNAEYFVLDSDNAGKYLKDNNYLTKNKRQVLPKDVPVEILNQMKEKSVLQRTCISYTVKAPEKTNEDDSRDLETQIYDALKDSKLGSRGLKADTNLEIKFTVLPFWLDQELLKESASYQNPPNDHRKAFGYERSLEALKVGRPISYASPLFHLPKVHEADSMQLGITFHDLLYHIPIDTLNPYVQRLIDLTEELKGLQLTATLSDKKCIFQIRAFLLDRDIAANFDGRYENIENALRLELTSAFELIEEIEDEKTKEQVVLVFQKHLRKETKNFMPKKNKRPADEEITFNSGKKIQTAEF